MGIWQRVCPTPRIILRLFERLSRRTPDERAFRAQRLALDSKIYQLLALSVILGVTLLPQVCPRTQTDLILSLKDAGKLLEAS